MNFTKVVLFYENKPITDFAAARNKLLNDSKDDWILFLDTDEVISQELNNEILKLVQNDNINGYYLKRDDYFFGRWLRFGETANVRLLRLGRKGSGKWKNPVHEVWNISGPTGELKNPLLHYSHPTIKSCISKINQYTDIAAKDKKFNFFELIYPIIKFIQNYFLRRGFLDGFPGFVMAYMMSLHSLIVRVKTYDSL